MLPRRLTVTVAATAALALSACAGLDGSDEGVVRDNVVEPGITAIDDARGLACEADASALRTALELYETVEGTPAPDEDALVDRGLVRAPSDLWDVVDGRLVAEDPGCGEVPTTAPAAD